MTSNYDANVTSHIPIDRSVYGSAPKSGGTTRFALPPNRRTSSLHIRHQMPMSVRQQPKSGYGAHPCDRRLRQRGVAVRQFGGIDHRCRLKQIDSRTNRMNLTIAFPCDNRLPVRPALMGKVHFGFGIRNSFSATTLTIRLLRLCRDGVPGQKCGC